MRGLYAIVDLSTLAALKLHPLEFACAVLAAHPAALQLRAKQSSTRETLELLRAFRSLCSEAGVPLYNNDRPDLAVLAECDGVHVGQDDLCVSEVRRFAPNLSIGVSTHDFEQLGRALADRADYVAFGPVFATRSKERPDAVVGLDGLGRARERAGPVPLVAIGGIDLERAAEVARHADCGAVIAALVPPEGDLDVVTERARSLHAALGGR